MYSAKLFVQDGQESIELCSYLLVEKREPSFGARNFISDNEEDMAEGKSCSVP